MTVAMMKLIKELELITVIYITSVLYSTINSVAGQETNITAGNDHDVGSNTTVKNNVSNISESIIDDYLQKRIFYSQTEYKYLSLLANYYSLFDVNLSIKMDVKITKEINDTYSKLKRLYSDYSQLHETLSKKNITTNRLQIYTLQELPEEPVLYIMRPHGYENKNHGITKEQNSKNYIIKQHNQARSQYYSARKDYSIAVFEFLREISVSTYLKVIYEYKMLINLGNLYHEVYLYVYNNNITSDKQYPFPEIPDVIIDTSEHWRIDRLKPTEQRPEFQITEVNITDIAVFELEWDLQERIEMYDQFFKLFKGDSENKVTYYLTVFYFHDFVRRYAVFDYLYKYRVANGNEYNKVFNLPSEFSDVNYVKSLKSDLYKRQPKSEVIPEIYRWHNLKELARSLLNFPPDVSSWKMKALTSDYLINMAWNLAINDLFHLVLKDGKALDYKSMPLNIVGIENNDNLANYDKLCTILKSGKKKEDNETKYLIQCPFPKPIS